MMNSKGVFSHPGGYSSKRLMKQEKHFTHKIKRLILIAKPYIQFSHSIQQPSSVVSTMVTPSHSELAAAEALLLIKGVALGPLAKASIKQAKRAAEINDKVTTVWEQWEPDLVGWKALMNNAKSPLHHRFYEMAYQRNAYLCTLELEKVKHPSIEITYPMN